MTRKSPEAGGLILGRYRVDRFLGRGEFGTVYLARDEKLQREVAIKILNDKYRLPENPELLPQEEQWRLRNMRERFIQEAKVAAGINHPNIVIVYELLEEGDIIVMEYLPGGTLAGLLAEARRNRQEGLPIDRTVVVLRGVCRGVSAAHSREIIHRDLKPDNIGFATADTPKTLDWGLAHVPGANLTQGPLANLMYGAPEQMKAGRIDHLIDIYALGAIAYKMVTGRYYLDTADGQSPSMAPDEAIETIVPTPPKALNPSIPDWLDALIMGMLEKAPSRRPQSMAEVITGLGGAVEAADSQPPAQLISAGAGEPTGYVLEDRPQRIDEEAVVLEARDLAEDEEPDRAIEVLREAVRSVPDSIALLSELSKIYLRIREYTGAARVCERIVELDSSHLDARRRLASAYRQLRRHEDALSVYKGMLEVAPSDYLGLVGAGMSLYRLQRRQEAARYLKQALTLRDDPGVRSLLRKCQAPGSGRRRQR